MGDLVHAFAPSPLALQMLGWFGLATTAAVYGYAGAASQKVSITLLKD